MTIKTNRSACRPPTLRRSWLFVAGLDQDRQREAMASGADVIVADLEEFTAPADRPAARARKASWAPCASTSWTKTVSTTCAA
jgi:citrate lyase subunit beta/citryl-CoA lyase